MPSFFMREISVVRLIPMRAAASGGLRTVQCWIGSDCDDNSSDLVARLEEAVSLNDSSNGNIRAIAGRREPFEIPSFANCLMVANR